MTITFYVSAYHHFVAPDHPENMIVLKVPILAENTASALDQAAVMAKVWNAGQQPVMTVRTLRTSGVNRELTES